MARLLHKNKVYWEEMESIAKLEKKLQAIKWKELRGKYITHPEKIRKQIASFLRCKLTPAIPWSVLTLSNGQDHDHLSPSHL